MLGFGQGGMAALSVGGESFSLFFLFPFSLFFSFLLLLLLHFSFSRVSHEMENIVGFASPFPLFFPPNSQPPQRG
jgi:hypothetical protein